MSKVYTDEEIDGLVKEVQDTILTPLFKAAEEELSKSEHGKKMESPKEGGNASEPEGGSKAGDGGNGPRSEVYSDKGKSAAPESKADGEGDRSAAYAKPGKSGKGGEKPSFAKDEPPVAAEASDEKPEAPAEDKPAESPEAPAADPAVDPAQEQGGEMDLVQAYSQLDEQALQAHWEALKQVMMQHMGGGDSANAGPVQPPAEGAPPAAPPGMEQAPPSPGAPPMGPPDASKAMGPSGMPKPPMPMMRSESPVKEEALSKAEAKIDSLEKQLEGLTGLIETMLTRPQRKAVTSMAEFVAKSEGDKASAPKLTKSEIRSKLDTASKKPDLKKSDQDLIVKYFLDGNVKLEEIQHLLK